MAAPPKTSDAAIIKSARTLLERYGRSGFSMNDVASRVGVRAPSLYSRFADRAALLDALEAKLWIELRVCLERQLVAGKPFESLRSQARAYRAFAKANPNGYFLLFDIQRSPSRESKRARAAASEPFFAVLEGQAGASAAARAVAGAARMLAPFIHGFVALELAGAMRGGSGLGAAFEQGVESILDDVRRAARSGKDTGRAGARAGAAAKGKRGKPRS
jgi:AcrR family transcriptional regulator